MCTKRIVWWVLILSWNFLIKENRKCLDTVMHNVGFKANPLVDDELNFFKWTNSGYVKVVLTGTYVLGGRNCPKFIV